MRRLCLRPPESLSAADLGLLNQFLAADPDLARAHDLVQRFRQPLSSQDVMMLRTWITEALASPFPTFQSFAKGLQADQAAVEAAVTSPWSNEHVAYCTSSP